MHEETLLYSIMVENYVLDKIANPYCNRLYQWLTIYIYMNISYSPCAGFAPTQTQCANPVVQIYYPNPKTNTRTAHFINPHPILHPTQKVSKIRLYYYYNVKFK